MADPILVTGAAGFIGSFVARRLLERGDQVVGIDDLNAYYDPALKEARLDLLRRAPGFEFHRLDIADAEGMRALFERHPFRRVVHLAAQAGVRYSLVEPRAYTRSNVEGFLNVLEGCRWARTEHLVYASSSSVYGANTKMPFSTRDRVDHPVSLYAATKKANELMAHTYSHLFGVPTTGLRFFTVYGPWGRPDMAYFSFTQRILAGQRIQVFNHGNMRRDFTYVEDIAEGVLRVLDRPPVPDPTWDRANPDPATSYAPYRVYNIGNHAPVELMDMIRTLERLLGRKAELELQPLQQGDVLETFADVEDLERDFGSAPHTTLEEGLAKFVAWYLDFYGAHPAGGAQVPHAPK